MLLFGSPITDQLLLGMLYALHNAAFALTVNTDNATAESSKASFIDFGFFMIFI
jgi:hypothetical protein